MSHNPRVLWAGLEPERPLQELHPQLADRLGVGRDSRLAPHLTLARANKRARGGPFRRPSSTFDLQWRFQRLLLVENRLTADAPEYTIVDRWPLQA